MESTMMDVPLTLDPIFERAESLFADKELVTATATGIERTNYGRWAERTRLLGGALDDLGISADGRVATFAWNTDRHLELYFAAPCSGRVLHTLNIRLFAEQVTYIANHAEDEVIFVDRSLLPALWPLVDTMDTVRHVVVMDDSGGGAGPDVPDDPRIVDYEDLISAASPAGFRVASETQAASMCYTSGTTGEPKGVVYSHRSTYLHTLAAMLVDSAGVCESDVILPVVPMFHANAWGLAHAAVAAGAKLINPGPNLAPKPLAELIETERVTVAAGVPTIWMGVLGELEGRDVSSLRAIPCGGSAVPKALSEGYREAVGLPILQAWGMTETSPLCSIAHIRSGQQGLDDDVKADLRTTVGTILPTVEFRICEPDTTDELPRDGESSGELHVRGPYVTGSYYNRPDAADSFTDDGWLRTGDVATCDPNGYIRLVDRTKDLIKSGGEWISSAEVENEIMSHPKVAEAAVVAVASERWMERPMACVVPVEGETITHDELIKYLTPRMARWWLPSATQIIDEVPKTSTGKFSKKTLRDRFADLVVE
ncbi:long-chain fatty acid--CoA ligase [Candidatus Poriferisodalis sp.]|uniref:long-chain fatty acid--CoA ligase n=1 Tax=Candidatus Poriferisodalis sp. TaxID=3101277 RepID=UPI003B01B13A